MKKPQPPKPRYRKEARRPTRTEVGIDSGNGDWRMFSLADLSAHGCNLVSTDWPFRVGQFVALKFSATSRIEGIVRWTRAGQVGIEFVRPLAAEIVAQMASPG